MLHRANFVLFSYVAGMRARYGALDNVMLWQAYPNLGE
jgi:hypothetical protein